MVKNARHLAPCWYLLTYRFTHAIHYPKSNFALGSWNIPKLKNKKSLLVSLVSFLSLSSLPFHVLIISYLVSDLAKRKKEIFMQSQILGDNLENPVSYLMPKNLNMSMNCNQGSKIMESTKEKTENQIWRELPLELLSSVMAYLETKDSVRASVVCKSWYEAAVSVRVIDKPPWLINFLKSGDSYEFYNPSSCKKHTMELPKSLIGYIVRYSRDGWLLMSKNISSDFVLFNPFTMDLVVLPYLELWYGYQLVGFSCAPTSSNCVVFTIKDYDPGHVTIRTWSPGETAWTSTQVGSQFLDAKHNYVVFSNGLFYCLNLRKCLAVFDPSLRTWNVLDVLPPRCSDYIDDESWYEGKFFVGYKGDILLICTYGNEDPLVFQLDLTQGIWEKKENLASLTIFVSTRSCESRTYVPERMSRNSIYFPKICYNETHCVTYSFDEGRYHPRAHNLDWKKLHSSENIWIEAPENALELIEKQMAIV